MKVDLLVSGGTVVTPSGASCLDLAVQGERIAALLAHPSGIGARRQVDARGKLVLPGGVDPHVHFENPSMGTATAHDFEVGAIAAACGGTTTVIDFAFQAPGETPLQTLRARRRAADGKAAVDYGLHACITRPDAAALAEFPAIFEFGAPTFKALMTYKQEGWIVEDGPLFEIMKRVAALGGMLGVHAENDSLVQWGIEKCVAEGDFSARAHARSRPGIVEAEAIRRSIFLASQAGCPLYIFHMSSAVGLAAVREARQGGQRVHAETCGHYLVFTDEALDGAKGYRLVMSPALKTAGDRLALWEGLADGSIECVGSDDAAYYERFKLRGLEDFRKIANGVPGVEIRLPLLYSEGVAGGRLTLDRFVEAVASRPARLFGLYPRKGALAVGSDADLVIFDPHVRWKPTVEALHTPIEYTCYEDVELQGKVQHVWLRGRPVVEDGAFVGEKGGGRFLARPLASHPIP